MIKISENIKILPKYRISKRIKRKRNKKKTTQEYKQELYNKNPNIEVLEEYINSSTEILHRCKICNHQWYIKPNNFLRHHGYCPKCNPLIKKDRTTDDYKKELFAKNPDIDVLEEYVGATTKILHRCKICNYQWYSTPSNLLHCCYSYCPKCNPKKKNKRTTEDYKKELYIINPNIEVIEDYIKAETKIKHHCLICDYYWDVSPNNILYGKGCPLCRNKENGNRLRKTHEQYVQELSIKNPKMEVIEKYINANTKILHKYKECGHEAMVTPSSALQGFGCNKCNRNSVGDRFKFSQSDYEILVKQDNPNVKILGKYISATDPILCECLRCGHTWAPLAGALHGKNIHGCPKCANKLIGDKLRKTLNQYIDELFVSNPYIKVIDKIYIDASTPLKHQCLVCNYIWNTRPSNTLRGTGCPICSLSHGEKEIIRILKSHNIEYEPQKRFDNLTGLKGRKLSYDFYLPKYNLLIEFQGEQHKKSIDYFGGEENFKKRQINDNKKREYAQNNNFRLLEIWYYDFNSIEEILLHNLNLNKECVETVIPA